MLYTVYSRQDKQNIYDCFGETKFLSKQRGVRRAGHTGRTVYPEHPVYPFVKIEFSSQGPGFRTNFEH